MATVIKTIGTAPGRDYATIQLWEADLDNVNVYASGDDAIGECYNDSIFTGSTTINGGTTVGLASVTLTVAESQRHAWVNDNTGVRINSGGGRAILVNRSDVTVEWIVVRDYGNGNDAGIQSAQDRVTIRNCLIIEGSGNANRGIFCSNGADDNKVHRNVCIGGFGIAGIEANEETEVFNNTVYGIGVTTSGIRNTANDGNSLPVLRNNLVVDCVLDYNVNNRAWGAGTTNNISSDTSAPGTGSLTNAVAVDEFVSIVFGAEDLNLIAGSTAIDAGVDVGFGDDLGALQFISSSPVGVTGDSDIAFDDMVSVSAATSNPIATASTSIVFDGITATSQGSISSNALLTTQLDGMATTATASSVASSSGSLSTTLENMLATGSASSNSIASSSTTFGDMVSVAIGLADSTAGLSAVFEDMITSASVGGVISSAANLSSELEGMVSASVASSLSVGGSAIVFEAMATTSSVEPAILADGSIVLEGMATTGTGRSTLAATGFTQLESMTVASSGGSPVSGVSVVFANMIAMAIATADELTAPQVCGVSAIVSAPRRQGRLTVSASRSQSSLVVSSPPSSKLKSAKQGTK